MQRRRHQKGQLIRTETGFAVRYYQSGEGRRRRVQTWLGDFKQLPNDTAAKNAMDAVLFTVNQNPTANPQPNTTTFRVFAQRWLTDCEHRKQKPVKPSVLGSWDGILTNHLNPMIGEIPLADCGNRTMRSIVERLTKKRLSPATIKNITLVVKLVRASAINEDGDQIFPIKWNSRFIDAPMVDATKQHKPAFTGEQVTQIVQAASGRLRMTAVLLAASGLRIGELLALECRHVGESSIQVEQAVWGGKLGTPKTQNAYRVVDLHPDVAKLLREYIGTRKKGFVFRTSSGNTLSPSNLQRRELNPILDSLKIARCGFHSFRRFRNTHLRQQQCPTGILTFWMGHADPSMSNNYDRSREDVEFRRDVAKAMGLGFQLPTATLTGANGRQEKEVEAEAIPC